MKIAISGKGGAGKTLLASSLARIFADEGYQVIAVDADPDSNLGASLGLPESAEITPLSEMKDLISERTQSGLGPYFKLNPKVDDIPQRFCLRQGNISLLVMGPVRRGGSGCYCPENAFLNSLISHLLMVRNEVVVMDMPAGIEHLSRGTAKGVDWLLIVVEPSRASIATASRIQALARDLCVPNVSAVGNKIQSPDEVALLTSLLPGLNIMGFIPFAPEIAKAELSGRPASTASELVTRAVREIYSALLKDSTSPVFGGERGKP